MLKPFKIKVENENHSREIQERLFSLGYRWWNRLSRPNQEVKFLEEKYLYLSKSLADSEPS